MTMNYLVYDCGDLLAGFMSRCVAETFVEEWRTNSGVRMDLVDGNTGEVLNTWVNGAWESED